jgi:hypothetical protein
VGGLAWSFYITPRVGLAWLGERVGGDVENALTFEYQGY